MSETAATTTPTTASPTAVPARGKVTGTKDGLILFNPQGTSYELHLLAPNYAGPVGTLVGGVIRLTARKLLTVPSGGNFIAPIFGTPRIIQGRVRVLDARGMLVQAGAPILVEFPESDSALDLNNGPIGVNTLVNVAAMPGARFEWVGP